MIMTLGSEDTRILIFLSSRLNKLVNTFAEIAHKRKFLSAESTNVFTNHDIACIKGYADYTHNDQTKVSVLASASALVSIVA